MPALAETGRRFTRRVRPDANRLTRDGAREKFRELEAIAKVACPGAWLIWAEEASR